MKFTNKILLLVAVLVSIASATEEENTRTLAKRQHKRIHDPAPRPEGCPTDNADCNGPVRKGKGPNRLLQDQTRARDGDCGEDGIPCDQVRLCENGEDCDPQQLQQQKHQYGKGKGPNRQLRMRLRRHATNPTPGTPQGTGECHCPCQADPEVRRLRWHLMWWRNNSDETNDPPRYQNCEDCPCQTGDCPNGGDCPMNGEGPGPYGPGPSAGAGRGDCGCDECPCHDCEGGDCPMNGEGPGPYGPGPSAGAGYGDCVGTGNCQGPMGGHQRQHGRNGEQ